MADYDPREDWWSVIDPLVMQQVNVTVTDNPVVAELLGPDGAPLRQWRARPAIGFTAPSGRAASPRPTA